MTSMPKADQKRGRNDNLRYAQDADSSEEKSMGEERERYLSENLDSINRSAYPSSFNFLISLARYSKEL